GVRAHEARALAGGGPLEHLLVAVGVAEGQQRPPADELLDADRLAGAVVDEVDLGLAQQHRLAVRSELVRGQKAPPDDLLGRDPVRALRPRAHELHGAAGHDVGLEAVRAQIGERLGFHIAVEHRLVPKTAKRSISPTMTAAQTDADLGREEPGSTVIRSAWSPPSEGLTITPLADASYRKAASFRARIIESAWVDASCVRAVVTVECGSESGRSASAARLSAPLPETHAKNHRRRQPGLARGWSVDRRSVPR